MPGKGDSITTKFKVDISDLKKGITEANQNIKLANAEFKAASAGMDNWARSSEGITAKLKQLSSVLTGQNKKLESYKKQQQAIDKAYAENGKRADELRAKMAQLASQGVSKTSEEYKKYEKALNDVEKEQIANKKASDNLKVTIANQQAVVNKTEKEMKDYAASLKDVEKAEKMSAKTGKSVEESLKDIAKEAENTKSKIGDLANKMAGGLKKGLTAIGAAATGFIASMVASSEASQEFIEDMGKLETAFTTSGHTAETAKKAYQGMVGILGETDQSVEAVNHLAKLTQSEKELAEWTNIAAGIYGTFGDSLPLEGLTEAANETAKVGKVTGPLADALNWAGVSEDAFNEALAKCNSEQERSTLITQTLSDIYREAGNTYQTVNADLIAARQATSDLTAANAEMGRTITPIITGVKQAFANFLNDVTPKIKEFVASVDWQAFGQTVENALGKIADGFAWVIENKDIVIAAISGMIAAFAAAKIIAFVSAISKVVTGIKAAAAAQGIFNAVMAANPIGLIVTAIGLLVAAIVLLIQNWDAVKEAAIKCWDAITNAVSNAWETIKTIWEPIGEFFSNIFNSILEALKPITESMGNAFKEAWELIKVVWDLVQPYFQNIWDNVTAIFSGVKVFFEGIFKAAWDAITMKWDVAVLYFTTVWNDIKSVFSVVKTFFEGMFSTAWEAIKAVWDSAVGYFEAIWDSIAGIFSVVRNVLTGNWSDAWNGIKGIVDTWKSYFQGVWGSIKNVFSSVKSWFKDTFMSAWEAVKNVFSNWGSFFGNLWTIIKDKFSSIGTNISNAISGAVKAGINGVISKIESTINSAIGIINGAINLINKLPGVSVGTVGTVSFPRLAKGGVLKKGQVGLLEGSGAEAVVPLEKNRYWIKSVAKEMQRQLATDVRSTHDAISAINNSNVNNFTQVINAPKSPSRIELYRQTKNLLALKGV